MGYLDNVDTITAGSRHGWSRVGDILIMWTPSQQVVGMVGAECGIS